MTIRMSRSMYSLYLGIMGISKHLEMLVKSYLHAIIAIISGSNPD